MSGTACISTWHFDPLDRQILEYCSKKGKMRTTGKKLLCYSSRNSFLKEIHSKLSPSLRSKKVHKDSKSCKLKSQSHTGKTRKWKKNSNTKPIGTLQKISDRHSANCQSSLKLLGKKTSLSHRDNKKNASGHDEIKITDKRKRRRRKKKNVVQDESSRLQRRARYLLVKMKLEQNLIDAYSGDGWKGQSREKIKPEKELQRAEKQILKCKLGIRDTIRQLDLLGSEGHIQDSVMYPDGSVFHEHIFCAKCKSREAFPDNDIILCDGTCNCGFHQECLEPPLEKIPPGDQGWLCKICECKMEILEVINAHLGTCFTVNTSWEDIFKEATVGPDVQNTFLVPAEEWPSEDSEDDDYHPERTENSNSRTGTEENVSDDASSSSSLFCSSDEARSYSDLANSKSWDGIFYHAKHKSKNEFEPVGSIFTTDSGEASDHEITSYRRQRRDVDYKKLYDEMFGKELNDSEQQSEDEDWGPYRRGRRRRESNAGTNIVSCRGEGGCSNMELHEKITHEKKRLFRIPPNAVEKLRQAFAEDELPSRAVKENLSKQLGISSEKVSKWFKNARYAALRNRKAEITQPQINNISKRSGTKSEKNQKYDKLASLDNSYLLPLASLVRVPKNLSKILRRKNPKSMTTPLRKQHKGAANVLTTDKVQVRTLLKDAVRLKWQVSGVGKKFPSERTCKTKGSSSQVDEMTDREQLCLVEMERLFSLEDRLQKLKKILLACKDNDNLPSKTHSREQNVIYVPVAEVMEKSRYIKQ